MAAQDGTLMGISRRSVLRTGAALGAAWGLTAISGVRRASAADLGTLKVIPEVDLKILDPVWTTATVTSTHALLVYDTLFGMDRKQQVHPQMVEKFGRDEDGLTWHFILRDGLGSIMMQRTERLDALDDKSFILKLKEPFDPVPQTLGNQSQVCFMMAAKIAETDTFTQIKTAIGSGPLMFLQEQG